MNECIRLNRIVSGDGWLLDCLLCLCDREIELSDGDEWKVLIALWKVEAF